MMLRTWLIVWSLSVMLLTTAANAATPPNIVLIYADDLGWGDTSCYGATAIQTPNIDRLANEGLRFTDAHSPSATCTPSRYAMMTGEYAWRRQGTGVLPGNASLIIEPGRTTMASILQQAGYRTGVVGKWHLGLGSGDLDWNGPIKPGPLELGFDECFLVPATGDRVPCVYVENHRVAGLDPKDPIKVDYKHKIGDEPTGRENPELLKLHPSHGHDMAIVDGISRIGFMTGGKAALWNDETMAQTLTGRATRFIEQHRVQPFFLFFSLHDIHVPRVPNPKFAGKSGMGARGDVILQADWCVGEILATLDRLKLADNTLILFTSDNGPVIDDGYQDQAREKLGSHRPTGPFRGGKYSNFEGGTRVPLLVRWPLGVKPGVSEAIVCQVDFPRSLATLARQTVADADAPDSYDVLSALLGESKTGRELLVEHAVSLSLRKGPLKYITPSTRAKLSAGTKTELGTDPQPQLYDLQKDPGETQDLADQQPETVQALAKQLEKIERDGRSRP